MAVKVASESIAADGRSAYIGKLVNFGLVAWWCGCCLGPTKGLSEKSVN